MFCYSSVQNDEMDMLNIKHVVLKSSSHWSSTKNVLRKTCWAAHELHSFMGSYQRYSLYCTWLHVRYVCFHQFTL